MDEKRRHFRPEQKVAILREHLKNKVPVSELCAKHGLHPNNFYRWEKELFEGAVEMFSNPPASPNGKENMKLKLLEEKLQKKQEVIEGV